MWKKSKIFDEISNQVQDGFKIVQDKILYLEPI